MLTQNLTLSTANFAFQQPFVRDAFSIAANRLGKWLKGAALLRARSEFPTVTTVVTWNATSNEPMLDINRRLGFKTYREIYQFQVELQKLKKYLEK